MTLEQLRIFIAVAEREHMTAAARALNVTQSAASAAIAALEERHAIKLFHRVGRGIVLTEAGQAFLIEAKSVIARAAAAEIVLDDLSGLKRGTLRVVASQTIAAYWLPPILAEFRRLHPSIRIELAIGNTDQAAARVHNGEADLGIVEGEVDGPALAHWIIGEDRLVLVQRDPFEANGADREWLRRAHWVMREEGSGTRSTLERQLRALGLDPAALRIGLILPSNEAVRTAVEAGAGMAGLSSLVVAPSIAAKTLHAAPIDLPPRPFFGLRHKERYQSKAAIALLDVIEARVW
jgi:DNA-binding transcriptional LysR family regulator